MEGMGGSPPVADWSHWSHCTAKYIQDTGLHWTLVWATAMDWIDKSDWVFSFQQLLNWCQSPLKKRHNVALHNYLSLILSKNCRDVVKSTGNTLVQFFPLHVHTVHIVHTLSTQCTLCTQCSWLEADRVLHNSDQRHFPSTIPSLHSDALSQCHWAQKCFVMHSVAVQCVSDQ